MSGEGCVHGRRREADARPDADATRPRRAPREVGDLSSRARELVAQLGCDCVYFLMFEGWKTEQVGNRWHYAARWARHLPVILVQPDRATTSPEVDEEQDSRLQRCHILHVKISDGQPTPVEVDLVQAGQIVRHMRGRGFSRPLLWLYNPHLAGSMAAVPSMLRVYHATENYFHFEGLPDAFLSSMRRALDMANHVIAVSDGVAESIRQEVPGAKLEIVTNGCDYRLYAQEGADSELMSLRGRYERLAVYAGNINARLDFDLMTACAERYRRTLWAYYGPVGTLDAQDLERWKSFVKLPNVAYRGPVPVTQIPAIYRCADVGIIPYRHERWLVENGFPLKALEMLASKLPVVSSYMKPLEGLSEHLRLVGDQSSFLDAVAEVDRSRLSRPELDALDALCREHDYDRKFVRVLELLCDGEHAAGAPRLRLDKLIGGGDLETWEYLLHAISALGAIAPRASVTVGSPVKRLSRRGKELVYRLYAAAPMGIKERLPEPWRRIGRRLFLG